MTELRYTLYLDFEFRSRVSLRTCGIYRTAADPSTEVQCAGWAVFDGATGLRTESGLWAREEALAAGLDLVDDRWGPDNDGFQFWAARAEVRVVAHSAEVERQILREKYQVDVPLARLSCTAARAARMSLPRSLEGACAALELGMAKDKEGRASMLKLARPRRPSREDRDEFWSELKKPEDFARMYDYCWEDLAMLVQLDRRLPELDETERGLWELTVEMNERGVAVDLPACRAALELCQRERARDAEEFRQLFGTKIGHAPGVAKALGLPDVQKATVRDALREAGLDPKRRRGLELRQRHARSSVDKLKAFLNRVETDGRVRGSLTYSGAERTQRWSGSGVQPQNFPRGMGKKTDAAFEELLAGALDLLRDDPVKTISEMLKGFILGPLLVGDYAQVEARVLAWVSGEVQLLELFASGADPYCSLATDIYGRKITKADVRERFMGKQGVLSCGYQVGPDKFRWNLDVNHDTPISLEMAKKVVYTFRNKYQRVVGFWSRMERAFVHAVRNSSKRIRASRPELPPIFMGVEEACGMPFAWIELPSGRRLWYACPEVVDDQVRYLGRSPYTRGWGWVSTYGGKITENVAQATSRDLIGSAMLRLRAEGFKLQLTVHDEAASDVLQHLEPPYRLPMRTSLESFSEEMNRVPAWAAGLPLVAECYRCERYRKD